MPILGYLRLVKILGDPSAVPPVEAIIPVSKSKWWAGIKDGCYPKPVKLGPRTTAWRVEDILKLIEEIDETQGEM